MSGWTTQVLVRWPGDPEELDGVAAHDSELDWVNRHGDDWWVCGFERDISDAGHATLRSIVRQTAAPALQAIQVGGGAAILELATPADEYWRAALVPPVVAAVAAEEGATLEEWNIRSGPTAVAVAGWWAEAAGLQADRSRLTEVFAAGTDGTGDLFERCLRGLGIAEPSGRPG